MRQEKYILLVEDVRTQALQVESILARLGYPIVVAGGAKEAFSVIREKKPLIIISDIIMPGIDGFEFCRMLKADQSLRDLRIVLLTQLSDPRDIIRGLESGADDFIVKPYNEELLLARVRAVLSLRLKQDEITRSVKILIVEDSPTQAEQLKFLLEEQGYSVHVAHNGRDGLDLARQIKPSIIVSDILMPVMDGYQMSAEIKQDPELKKIPIILITALTERGEIVKKASVVADGFFTKPYDDNYLLTKIESLIADDSYGEDVDGKGIEINFSGERYVIGSHRRQILSFLMSTYESAVQQNRDLLLMQRELQLLNEQLEERVAERTQMLQASELKFRTLLETNADGIVVVSRDKIVYFANRAAEALFGLRSDQMVGKPFLYDLKGGQIRDVEIPKEEGAKAFAEARVVDTIWGEERAYLATFRDVTERKMMEEALRESEENFRAIAENANAGIFITMNHGEHVYANRRAAEITGFTVKELIRKSLKDLAQADASVEKLSRATCGEMPESHFEAVIVNKDGRSIPVEIVSSRTTWHGRPACLVFLRDITERAKKEEELIKSSKLESLSTLAGGIAHDFNNLLTGVVGNASLAKAILERDSRAYEIIENLEKASVRARDLTQQLLTFAKGGSPVKKSLMISDLLKESVDFALRGSGIKAELSIQPGLYWIEVDEGQITQVIHNLIINAKQAMPGGGILKISAENAMITETVEGGLPAGDYVKVTVADTGSGIPEEYLSRIFDPYFTTKKEGTGLGLATVYSIIKNHGGYISVDSKKGEGTCFYFYLPAMKGYSPVEGASQEPQVIYGKGSVLIMDDEEIVREAAGSILEELGYMVEFAVDGEEAIEKYRGALASGRPFDAVIMDLTIPGGLGGKDAVKRLKEIDPNVKAIVSSGYSHDSIMSDYRKHGFTAVVVKPYTVKELSSAVHKVVTGKSTTV